jgi:transposase
MWYIGVDAHKKHCFLVAKDATGTLLRRGSFPHTPEGWRAAFADVPPGSRVAVESVGWYGVVIDLLRDLGLDAVLVNPRDVHLIAKSKRKTDPHDADTLCDLLRTNFLPTAYAPPKDVRELRELTRHHDDLVKTTTRIKNTIHRLLERAWVQLPPVSDLFGAQGRKFLRGVEVSPAQQVVLVQLLMHLDATEELRKAVEAIIARQVKDDAEVHLLLTIDGFGPMAAATLKAEIGEVGRFRGRKQVRMNFGVAPSVRDSADTERRGRITKQGRGSVRKAVVQAVPHFVKHHPVAHRKQHRLRKARGPGVARMAMAADILDVAYQVLKTRTPYRHVRPDALHRKRRKFNQLVRRAEGTWPS